MADTFDFIVVGAGTSGCLLAHHLAASGAAPSILVLESGSTPSGSFLNAPAHRYHAAMIRPDLDHGYVSEPEPALNARTIAYTRGKGLGGSSILNFGVYLKGSSADYDEWARRVGDESWAWETVKGDYVAIETYEFDGSSAYSHLAKPQPGAHGTRGKVKAGLPPMLEKGVLEGMQALVDQGEEVCLDPNNGDPIGVSVFPYSYSKDGRSTSAIAHLKDAGSNLKVWTDASVTRLLWSEDGSRVVGVETADGRKAYALKDVILSAGAIDTPRLLLVNGIGPEDELAKVGVTVKKDLPGVGKHLQDHVLAFMSVEVDGAMNDRWAFESDENLMSEAAAMWEKDKTGAFALQHSCPWGGFLKHPELSSFPEYTALPSSTQQFLAKDNVPTYEFINNGPAWPPGVQIENGNSYMTCVAFLMNPQSEGSITLRSADPNEKPIINLNFLTHPYDARIMREAVRSVWTKITHNKVLKASIKRTLCGPASLSDDDVDAFVRDNASTVWHACGSVMMGKEGEKGVCVDKDYKVLGVKGLRVADLSVCPLTTNNHTQPTAYLVGYKAAQRLIEEYGLKTARRAKEGTILPKM
ncbi:GMC oxidoreductase [Didymella exigua CBS 183.55]|uniref:GMC oxidoreductase n=1 Tax=Didymella exigua CBS 183.55 TaxID=1150837 RepID=A0A6A5R6S7_9PLEO|nr:GMC oxidoreductase [Didymella exigua CBS 183.55]KAF1923845.1 GMC oxidoreductase [Didymella exigua CBS 183.55]